MKVTIGTRNSNRLSAGTHSKKKILRCMGFRFGFTPLPQGGSREVEMVEAIVDPKSGDLVPLEQVRLIWRKGTRAYAKRDLYPDELEAMRRYQERHMAAQAKGKRRHMAAQAKGKGR